MNSVRLPELIRVDAVAGKTRFAGAGTTDLLLYFRHGDNAISQRRLQRR